MRIFCYILTIFNYNATMEPDCDAHGCAHHSHNRCQRVLRLKHYNNSTAKAGTKARLQMTATKKSRKPRQAKRPSQAASTTFVAQVADDVKKERASGKAVLRIQKGPKSVTKEGY